MNWEFIIIMVLVILGAGLVAGGVVVYRSSAKDGIRAFGAAAVAAGVVMWAVVLITTPVSYSGEGPSAPEVGEVVVAE